MNVLTSRLNTHQLFEATTPSPALTYAKEEAPSADEDTAIYGCPNRPGVWILRQILEQTKPGTKTNAVLYAATSLLRTAYRTKPAVELTLSLRMAAARCVSVVFTLRLRIALMLLLLCPSATNLTIVFSRGVST
jgi:hypothetical protein